MSNFQYDWNPVVTSLLYRLQRAGLTLLAVDDGEGFERIGDFSSTVHTRIRAVSMISAVDFSYLQVSCGAEKAILTIVLDSGPSEILADWRARRGSAIDAVIDEVADAFALYWENRKIPTVVMAE